MKSFRTIWWEDDSVILIDQTKLPCVYTTIRCRTVDRLVTAIKRLEVRGAPALGVAGGYGVALAALTIREKNIPRYFRKLETTAGVLSAARPTAVNLSWAVNRVLDEVRRAESIEEIRQNALAEAERVAEEDAMACHALGDHGASIIPDGSTVLTHCNAGALACREWGTALGVIRSAVQAGKEVRVIACETRPLFQGARLTAWELDHDGISVTVIPDSAAAHLMRKSEVNCVLVGADRITRDVVFNKVGTYMHALVARAHGIPFYVAAPFSTFDPDHSEDEIEIEDRGREEVARCGRRTLVPENVPVRNPAFDATPLSLVTAVISPGGVLTPPFDWTLMRKKRRVI